MERKRKLPPRAAARSEQAAKKRNVTPRERSATPATAAVASPVPEEPEAPPPPPPLPKSIQAGKPLPTVEDAQVEDLSVKDYQTVGESGVLAESLARSRHKWISEGLFEKYWTKPHKRKGVVNEDPKNPPKDSMTKVGTVTITIEPHVIEATMFAVKESKLKQQQQLQQQQQQQQPNRPILQYGPPNGSMPPPPTPSSGSAAINQAAATASPKTTASSPALAGAQSSPRPATQQSHPHISPPAADGPRSATPIAVNKSTPSPSPSLTPGPPASTGAIPPSATPPQPSRAPSDPPLPNATFKATPAPATPVSNGLAGTSASTPASGPTKAAGLQPMPVTPVATGTASPRIAPGTPGLAAAPPRPPLQTPTAGPSKPATPAPAAKPAANDPVIALLAQRASGDPELRDLMKRVAIGQAKEGELAHFQRIIDQLNAEYKSKGGQQGPSADRLLVDGRTVKYFADEVRTILDIVLASNPHQKSTELRPPPRSDPLVVLLVKNALENGKTKDMIRRIAEGRPGFTDATDLKEILDRLHREMKAAPRASPAPSQAKPALSSGTPNGHAKTPNPQPVTPHPTSQALRSKGPPPLHKPDISGVVFDFGTGDRYLFPKYSILEYLPTTSGQQVVASFLIVRKGSISEYGGDPKLDYYQPVTIRLYTHTGRHLENLARVVAPQDEVRRYMDDVMDNMTRAEYVLLAMRLPRATPDEKDGVEGSKTNGTATTADAELNPVLRPGVLWTTKSKSATPTSDKTSGRAARDPEEEGQAKYQRLIQAVTAKDTNVV